MSLRIGLDAKLYYGTAGSQATGEITGVNEVTLNLEKGEAAFNSRASAWEIIRAGLKKGSVEFKIPNNTAHSGVIAALADAFVNDTNLAFLILDAAGGNGLDADFVVLKFNRSEPLEDAQTYDVSIKPTYVSRYPAWV